MRNINLTSDLRTALKEVMQSIEREDSIFQGLTLGGGYSGRILLCAQLNKLSELNSNNNDSFINKCFRSIEKYPTPALFNGYLGFPWVMSFLENEKIATSENSTMNFQIDEIIIDLLEKNEFTNFDLISGLIGFGIYGLERVNQPSGEKILTLVYTKLLNLAHEFPDGSLYWISNSDAQYGEDNILPNKYINMGVAHGMPSICAFFAKYYSALKRPPDEFFYKSLNWFINQASGNPNFSNTFPSWVGLNGEKGSHSGRVAWCNGDLGIAACILLIGKYLNNEYYFNFGNDLAERVCHLPIEKQQVTESIVCHGFSGNALIFHRLFRQTNNSKFKIQYTNYIKLILNELASKKLDALPYGLLMGKVGIGLVLATLNSRKDIKWDRVMLIS